MKKVNVGVVGVGAMGHNHVRVYTRLKNANLLAVSDLMKGTLAEVSKKYNTVGFVDYDNVLKMPEIDAVSVCVPTTYHYEVVMSAIEQGKHVLVEKPIAFTLKEAKDMVKAARKQGVKLATGHVERFNPAVLEAKKLLRDKLIGEVVSVSAKRVGPFPPRIKDVGVTIDLAIHEVDVMAYLMDSPVSKVYAHVGSRLEKCEYEDHAEIMMEFYNNAIDTPGEYLENKNYYRALIMTAVDADIIAIIADPTVEENYIPPSFATTFAKEVIGIITKIGLVTEDEQIENTQSQLEAGGVSRIFKVDTVDGIGIKELFMYLKGS